MSQPTLEWATFIKQLFSIVPQLGRALSEVEVKFNKQLDRRALIDTGAFAAVISHQFYKEFTKDSIMPITEKDNFD